MSITFEELRAQGGCEGSPLEVVLFEGITFNIDASTIPYAYGRDKTSERPGTTLVGYVHSESERYIEMSPERPSEFSGRLGGWNIHKDAIYSIREMTSK